MLITHAIYTDVRLFMASSNAPRPRKRDRLCAFGRSVHLACGGGVWASRRPWTGGGERWTGAAASGGVSAASGTCTVTAGLLAASARA